MLQIRKSTIDDLDELKDLFSYARKNMKENGNPNQWKNDRPSVDLVINDINNSNSYVVLDDDKIVGTFTFIIGIEPTYIDIDGKWLNDSKYGTIHRIASRSKGIFDEMMKYVSEYNVDIRIDTHRDNKPMLHLIEKHGFKYCGIIIVDDGTERLAFHKTI